MITNINTLSAPVGITPDGEPVTIDLRRTAGTLIAGVAGTGKTTMLRRMRDALVLQVDANHLFHAGGIRPTADGVIAAAHEELQRRLQEPSRIADGPVALLVDDFGVLCIGRDAADAVSTAVRDIAIRGRATDVHLVIATQGTEGLSTQLLSQMSTRIVLGRLVRPISRAFSDMERQLIADAAINPVDRSDGVLVGADGRLTRFTTPPRSQPFTN